MSRGKADEKKDYEIGYGKPPKNGVKFKKGQSGNPAGKIPGTRSITSILQKMLDKDAPEKLLEAEFVKQFIASKQGVTNSDIVVARLIFNAVVKGDHRAIQEIIDRIDGKAKQSIDITSEGEKLQITIGGKQFDI